MRSPTVHRMQLWVRQPYLQMVYIARRTSTGGLGSLTIRSINCNAYRCDAFRMWVGKGQHKCLPRVAYTLVPPLFTYCKDMKGTVKLETGGMHGGLGDHPGLSATWKHISTCADREHIMKTLRSDKGICANNLTISVVTWGWSASPKLS